MFYSFGITELIRIYQKKKKKQYEIYAENFTAIFFFFFFFSDKNSDIFHMSAQNIVCRYSLEPPRRGGSNEYPQSMFLRRK